MLRVRDLYSGSRFYGQAAGEGKIPLVKLQLSLVRMHKREKSNYIILIILYIINYILYIIYYILYIIYYILYIIYYILYIIYFILYILYILYMGRRDTARETLASALVKSTREKEGNYIKKYRTVLRPCGSEIFFFQIWIFRPRIKDQKGTGEKRHKGKR